MFKLSTMAATFGGSSFFFVTPAIEPGSRCLCPFLAMIAYRFRWTTYLRLARQRRRSATPALRPGRRWAV